MAKYGMRSCVPFGSLLTTSVEGAVAGAGGHLTHLVTAISVSSTFHRQFNRRTNSLIPSRIFMPLSTLVSFAI